MARPHHYTFTHVTLRQIFFEDPPALVKSLQKYGVSLLQKIWYMAGEQIKESEDDAILLPSVELDCSTRELGSGTVAVIVSPPPPEEAAEAYFVGLVLCPPRKRFWGLLGTRKGVARYLVLERGDLASEDHVHTVLCAWDHDVHMYMGRGPEPTISEFSRKLATQACM